MSENASEIRARRAREQVDSLAANPRRSSDDWSTTDWRELAMSSHGRASPVGEPLFTPVDWSLPSFRGSTVTGDAESAGTARPQAERSRPIPLEPQVRDPFDSWSPDLWFSPDDAPRSNSHRRHRGPPHRSLSELFAPPNEPYPGPEESLYDRTNPLTLLRDPTHRSRDPRGWFTSDSRAPAAAPTVQPHVRPPSTVNARRDYATPFDTSDVTSGVDTILWRRFDPAASASQRANADRDTDTSTNDSLEANSRRRLSRLLALRNMRGDAAPERDAPPSRSPTRTTAPAPSVYDYDSRSDSDDFHHTARAALRATRPSIFDSPPRPASRAAPSTTASVRRMAPTARPTAAREAAARANPTPRFNIESFHQGPFRATIQRSLEMQNQQRQGAHPSTRDPGAPSLPPLRFQRNRDERLVSAMRQSNMHVSYHDYSRLCRVYRVPTRAQILQTPRHQIHTICIQCWMALLITTGTLCCSAPCRKDNHPPKTSTNMRTTLKTGVCVLYMVSFTI